MPTDTLSESERDVMQHALGLDHARNGKPYRNYFACNPGDKTYLPIWEGLLARGLCTKRENCGSYTYYYLTEEGAAALGHKLPE